MSLDAPSFLMKAKMFLNRSIEARRAGNFDTAALDAAIALELLGKAALARTSPLLVADPNSDDSLLVAVACHRLWQPGW